MFLIKYLYRSSSIFQGFGLKDLRRYCNPTTYYIGDSEKKRKQAETREIARFFPIVCFQTRLEFCNKEARQA
ncbi:hypothetical protein BpHYR1_050051 [Brachionus plicatilis]|uniref:Uncharacterized protein n=1 Tax=Brachionus plicatilis TaxID=10195 RepID=A0A3M7S434_BRAPC|nr:hypothetical protein BpHYR1_050051 [Brachionus plicatilis]